GQDVSNLLSSILRIDVDHQQGEQNYRIPDDNPFVELPDARPEIWAYGFRNPWRMSFDREKGDLWVGDVGWQLWEMIYRVQRGGNYGWSVMEGPQPALPEAARGPTPILPPTVSHPHSEAASITGGYVYHGKQFPELEGAYIYGDFQTGKVWGLRHDGQQATWHQELAQTPLALVGFAEDRTGELYLLDYERSQQIFRLAKNETDGSHADFPRQLSQTGLFADTAAQVPAAGVLEYSINAPHWADHTTSRRWLAVPGDEPVGLIGNDSWQFPEGSVLVKTVSIDMHSGDPSTRRKLETQVLHREQASWRPYTYVWNDEQTDALLADAAGSNQTLSIGDPQAPGNLREQTYHFASRTECQLCHNAWVETKTTTYGVQTASLLAFNSQQLNKPITHDGTTSSQLALWRDAGIISEQVPINLEATSRYVDPRDHAADLEQRVRSYLQVNCAHCHQPHAGGAAMIDLRYVANAADAKIVDVRPAQGTFGISNAKIVAPGDPLGSVLHYRMAKVGGGRMPRIGSEQVDEAAVAMIQDWISGLPPANSETAPQSQPEDENRLVAALSRESAAERAEAIREITSTTRGALALLQSLNRGQLSNTVRQEAIALTAEHPMPEVRDLFERFVPPSQRVKRLGTVVNAAELLAMPADMERGRQFFFREGSATCKGCHRVGGKGETLGPDLSQIGKKYQPHDLLTHLLEPSKFIDPKYVSYLLETVDGRVLTGLLIEKNDSEVRLKDAQNKESRIPAADVETLVPQPKSLMPELLLRDLTPQQAADLLAYLISLK
ncbi:MAG: PQQ-dependent sugar dehydrogenase, partial [Pirellulales bacterium]